MRNRGVGIDAAAADNRRMKGEKKSIVRWRCVAFLLAASCGFSISLVAEMTWWRDIAGPLLWPSSHHAPEPKIEKAISVFARRHRGCNRLAFLRADVAGWLRHQRRSGGRRSMLARREAFSRWLQAGGELARAGWKTAMALGQALRAEAAHAEL